MESVSILPATAAHAPVIVKLLLELAEVLDHELGISPHGLTMITRRMIDEPRSHILLAETNGQIVGLISFTTRQTLLHPAPSGLIDELIVSRQHRRKGLGRRLVTEAVEYCRKLGCVEVEVSTEKENRTARAFYRRCGFEEDAVLLERHFTSEHGVAK